MASINANITNTRNGPRDGVLAAAVNPDGTLIGQNPAFWDGHLFRTFRSLSVPVATPLVIRAVVPVNTILEALELSLIANQLVIETVVGGTPGGTFNDVLPAFNRNNMTGTPAYTPQVTLAAGGTHTGGTVIDVLEALVGNGGNAQVANVGTGQGDNRGIAPNTYYFRCTATGGTATGVFSARWEERP